MVPDDGGENDTVSSLEGDNPRPRPLEEIRADLIELSKSEDEAEKEEISERVIHDLGIIYFTLSEHPKGRETVLSFPEMDNMAYAVKRIAKKPGKKLVIMTSEQLGHLYASYEAETFLGGLMAEAEKLRSAAAIPEEAITRLRNSLRSHLSNPHEDLRSRTINIFTEYRNGLETEGHPSYGEKGDSAFDPLDGYYILSYTIRLFEEATADYNDVRVKLSAINSSTIDSARILLRVFDGAKIAEKLDPGVGCWYRNGLETILKREKHTPADLDTLLVAGNRVLAQLGDFLLSAVQGTSFEGKLDYKEVSSPEEESRTAKKGELPKEYRRSVPSRVFSDESFVTLNKLADGLAEAQDADEAIITHIKGMLDEAYTAMGLVEAQIEEIRLPYHAKDDLCSLVDKMAEGQRKDLAHEFTVKLKRLYEVGNAYTKLVFWKRRLSSLREELKSESQVYEDWGETMLAYIRLSDYESKKKAEKLLIASRRSLMSEEENESLNDEEVLSAVHNELTNKERPDLVLRYAAALFEVAIGAYTNLANDACKKWRNTAGFVGHMLMYHGGVSSLAGSLGITADDSAGAELMETYKNGMGPVFKPTLKEVGDTMAAANNVLRQFGEFYLKIFDKVAEERQG